MSVKSVVFSAAAVLMLAANIGSAGDVNVYSYRQPELIQPLIDAFEESHNISVNVAFVEKGMVERLAAEGRRSPADVILTVDIARLIQLADAGLLQNVQDFEIQQKIPAEFRDSLGAWFGLTSRARAIYASKTRVQDGEITTYEALASPQWRGRICTRSGLHSYNLGLISALIAHHDEAYVEEWLNGLKENLARKPQGNDRAQVKAIFAGECDIAIGNTYYMGAMLADEEQKNWAQSVRIVYPHFENGGTHVNISGMAMAKYAPNPENAREFMAFLASDAAQEIYASTNHETPVAPHVPLSELVASWGSFKPDTIPLQSIGALRSLAVHLVEKTGFDL